METEEEIREHNMFEYLQTSRPLPEIERVTWINLKILTRWPDTAPAQT
jgi:hypothetical protein